MRGAGPLKGEVPISGSKNAALPVLTAAILFDQPLSVTNVPDLRDITTLCNLLETLGILLDKFCLPAKHDDSLVAISKHRAE